MPDRLPITKTYKLYIGGQFPRSESGRSMIASAPGTDGPGGNLAHVCRASRKDLRDAVVAARNAFEGASGWPRRSAYNRGQILYRLAEMMEGKRQELADALAASAPRPKARGAKKRTAPSHSAMDEVAAAIDRIVAFAGWTDKFAHVLGCQNPVAGPYYNFTAPEPTGVAAVVCPDDRPLLALVSLIAPALCAGDTVVVLASERVPVPACIFAEGLATSDLPPGVINVLTGERAELLPHIASHREIDAIHAANLSDQDAQVLREGAAENLKRITIRRIADADWFDHDLCASPSWIEPLVEMKTIWHPAGA